MPLPEDLGLFRRAQDKRRFQCMAGLVPRAGVKRVLDVGAGTGWLSEMLAERGFETSAVDLGLDSIRRAKKRLEGKSAQPSFFEGDVYALPCRSGSFDACVAVEILEHLEKPADALLEIARVLRPGGFLVVATPFREKIEQILCIHCNRKTPANAHLHSFDENTLPELLKSAGFIPDRTVRIVSRPAERFGLAGLTGFFPYQAWRMLDAVFCRLLGRECYIAVRAVLHD
jgi:ubiquinone/menaquinone biosynthesis C-methylase UbiE